MEVQTDDRLITEDGATRQGAGVVSRGRQQHINSSRAIDFCFVSYMSFIIWLLLHLFIFFYYFICSHKWHYVAELVLLITN